MRSLIELVRLGDIFDSLCALMVYRTCVAADIPASLKSRMLLNIMVILLQVQHLLCYMLTLHELDFAVGLVPLLGDVADALFRASEFFALGFFHEYELVELTPPDTRNAALLYTHLKARGAERIAGDEKGRGNSTRERSQSRGRGGQQNSKAQRTQSQPKRDREYMQLPAPPNSGQRTSSALRNGRSSERSAVAAQQQPKRFVTADDLDRPQPTHAHESETDSPKRGWLKKVLGGASEPSKERDVENLDDVPNR